MIAQFVRGDLLCLQQRIQGSRIVVKPCVAPCDIDQEASPPFPEPGGQPGKIHLGNVPDSFPGTAQFDGHGNLVDRHIRGPEHRAQVSAVFSEPISANSRSLE
jgi:hypothetical protein